MATKWVLADYFQLTDWWLEEFISYFTLAVRFVFCQHSREGGMVWSRHLWNHFSVLIVKKATNHKSLTLWDLISLSWKVDLFKTTLFKTTFKTQRYAGFLLVDFNFVFSTSLLSSKTLYPFFHIMYSTAIQRMVLLKLILEHTTAVFLGEICLLPCDFVGQLILLWGLSVLIAQVQENNYFWPRASKSKPVFSQRKYSIYEDLKIVEMSFCFVADIQELRMVKNGLNDLGSSIKSIFWIWSVSRD